MELALTIYISVGAHDDWNVPVAQYLDNLKIEGVPEPVLARAFDYRTTRPAGLCVAEAEVIWDLLM